MGATSSLTYNFQLEVVVPSAADSATDAVLALIKGDSNDGLHTDTTYICHVFNAIAGSVQKAAMTFAAVIAQVSNTLFMTRLGLHIYLTVPYLIT